MKLAAPLILLKKSLSKFFILLAIYSVFSIAFSLFPGMVKTVNAAATCSYSGPNPAKSGDAFTVTYSGFAAGETIGVWDRLGGTLQQTIGTTEDSLVVSKQVNSTFTVAPGGYSVMIQTRFPVVNFKCTDIDILASSGGGDSSTLCTSFKDCTSGINTPGLNYTQPKGLIGQILTDFIPPILAILGFLTVIIIVISGIQFVTSSGDPESAAKARGRLTYAIIGFIIIILAFAITRVVDVLFLGSTGVI